MKKHSCSLLSVISSIGISVSSLEANLPDFGQGLPEKSDFQDFYFQNPNDLTNQFYHSDESMNSFLDMQGSFSLSDPNNPSTLPSRDDLDIQYSLTLQNPTISIPSLDNPMTPTVINQIAAPIPPTALPRNTNNPIKKRRSSTGYRYLGYRMLECLPAIEDMPLENIQHARQTARKVGRTNGRTRDISETGWLFAVAIWYMQYIRFNRKLIEISKGSTLKVGNRLSRLRCKIAGLKDRLQRAQQSLNLDALKNLSDEEKDNFLKYLSKIAPKCKGRLRMLIENGYDRLTGNTNALSLRIVLPNPLPDPETLRRLPEIADDEMPQEQVNEAIGILSSVGNVRYSNRSASGWLQFVTRAASDVSYLDRQLDCQKSFNQDTLTNITDEFGRAAVKKYLPLLAEKSTQPIRDAIEDALSHLQENPNALATMTTTSSRTISQSSSDIDSNASTISNENPSIATDAQLFCSPLESIDF